jgi:hypothetical protein
MYHDVSTAIGKGYQDFKTKIADFWKDGKITPEETAQITQITNNLRSEHALAVSDIWSKIEPDSGLSLNSHLGNDTGGREAAIKNAKDNFDLIIEAAVTGNTGTLKLNQAIIDSQTNSDVISATSRSEWFRKMRILKELGGEQWFNILMNGEGQSALSSMADAVLGMTLTDVLTATPDEQKAMTDYVKGMVQTIPDEKEQAPAVKALIEDSIATITSKDPPITVAKTAARALFSSGNTDFLTNFKPGDHNSNWQRLYNQMVSPDVTARMLALGKEEPQLWQDYKTWAVDQWPALFSGYADELNTISQFSHGNLGFEYIPESGQIAVTVKNSITGDPLELAAQTNVAQIRVQELNAALSSLNPIWDADKTDKAVAVEQLLKSLGVTQVDFTDEEDETNLKGEDSSSVEEGDDYIQLASLTVDPFDEDSDLGSISAEYESGGRGVSTISSGEGDPGGVSYGTHQLASRTGTMSAFLGSEHATSYAPKFEGVAPGSEAFNAIYQQVVNEDAEGFAQAQKAFITEKHYEPVANHAKGLGFDVESKAVQEALFSMGVQHGGAKKIVSAAAGMLDDDPSPDEMVMALYDARRAYVKKLRKLPKRTKRSVLRRYVKEEDKVLALLD